MNVLHIGINLSNNTISLGPWSDNWTDNNKLDCLKNISHNFILNDVEYPSNLTDYIDILTMDPCISYDGVFHIDSNEITITIKMFLLRLLRQCSNKGNITFYYYHCIISNIKDVNDILNCLTYTSPGTWCNII